MALLVINKIVLLLFVINILYYINKIINRGAESWPGQASMTASLPRPSFAALRAEKTISCYVL